MRWWRNEAIRCFQTELTSESPEIMRGECMRAHVPHRRCGAKGHRKANCDFGKGGATASDPDDTESQHGWRGPRPTVGIDQPQQLRLLGFAKAHYEEKGTHRQASGPPSQCSSTLTDRTRFCRRTCFAERCGRDANSLCPFLFFGFLQT